MHSIGSCSAPACATHGGIMTSLFQACLPRIHLEEAYEPVGRCAPIDGVPKVPALEVGSAAVEHLQQLAAIPLPADAPLEELLAHSAAFPQAFPIQTPRVRELLKRPGETPELLCAHANSTYPLLLEGALFLAIDFLEFKKRHGSDIERHLYAGMGVTDLVHRILEKRAVSFCGNKDRYMLLNGKRGIGGWDEVGTDNEKPPLLLQDCLSYDEMKISSLLSVSSNTVFINEGHRMNHGKLSLEMENVERYGVIMALIGPRLERKGVNEWQEVLVTKDQNTKENGYGRQTNEPKINTKFLWRKMWARFYGIQPNLPIFDEAFKNFRASKKRVYQRFTELSELELFDNLVYQKRIAVSAETLLLEAEHRAAAANKTAFVHVVGLGLGVWIASEHQEKEFMNAFASCLNKLGSMLSHVSDVRFGWFHEERCGSVGDGGIIAGGIRLHFDNTPPHSALRGEHAGKLLIVSYAWDMNSLPGNEFWAGHLTSSGDPAAACSSQVAELQNPHINRAKVCGTNLHVASQHWGVVHVAEYAHRKLLEVQLGTKEDNEANSPSAYQESPKEEFQVDGQDTGQVCVYETSLGSTFDAGEVGNDELAENV